MSGGGGSTTTQSIPKFLEDAAKENLARARYVSQIGYVPQYGNDVAAFSPMQQSAFNNTSAAANAFGLGAPVDANAYMPKPVTDNLGFTGYSSGAMFDQYMNNLERQRPSQFDAINSMFVDPYSGDAPVVFTPAGSITTTQAPSSVRNMADYTGSSSGELVGRDGIPWNRNVFNNFGELSGLGYGLVHMLPFGGAIAAYNNKLAAEAKAAYEKEVNKNPLLMPTVGFDPSGTDYSGAIASVEPAYSGGSYTPSDSGNYGVGGSWSSSSSDGGGYTGGGSSWGGNPSSTISGGSGRTDGGFGW